MARPAMGKLSFEAYPLRPVPGAPAPPVAAHLPVFIYGTAWKKERTADLVHQAISSGFRAVDTAAQPKHYREDLVGEGVRRAIREGIVRREDLHIQTKFTSVNGQSPNNMPYDPSTSITQQVHASIASSLHNLHTNDNTPDQPNDDKGTPEDSYIDLLLLHSPLPTMSQTVEAWTAAESYVPHRIRNLGISNTTLPILRELSSLVRVPPAVVQNRFYVATQFDVPLREFCREQRAGIIYQSFWTLTANPELLRSGPVGELASWAGVSREQALYCLVLGLGRTTVLNGTTDRGRMWGDLAALGAVERAAGQKPRVWEDVLEEFRGLVGDSVAL
ncbi:Aldo/keto reductase [Aspergillus taichungensis]|uniref:Aldo/keto reductase n=1 Tax=Aspergillus taichungensis TaxID=482145 RepID=A0A2J5I691_9EURO|nr:Aldo/keto reductase [Aspergillus taichungensis]